MLSFFKGIFTCSWRTKKQKNKVTIIFNITFSLIIKEYDRNPFDRKEKINRVTQNKLREIVSDLNHHIKNVKLTSEPSHRYIIPSKWLRSKLETLNRYYISLI